MRRGARSLEGGVAARVRGLARGTRSANGCSSRSRTSVSSRARKLGDDPVQPASRRSGKPGQPLALNVVYPTCLTKSKGPDVSRADLLNAFRPASEVDDPQLFAGRQAQVLDLTDALHSIGTAPIIYGHRGLGKSSLALQMMRIAMGDVELLSRISAEDRRLSGQDTFLTFFVTCTDKITDLKTLLQALVNAMENVEFAPSGDGNNQQLVDHTTRKKLILKVFELESTKKYETKKRQLSNQDLSIEEKLVHLVEVISEAYGQPVLFIIDELDTMGSTAGLAGLIKAVSGERLKFLLIGIASNLAELLADHQSLERQLVPVQVPLMDQAELRQIVTGAEAALRDKGLNYRFSSEAKNQLTRIAAGFPWFVHLFGQAALAKVEVSDDHEVQESDIIYATENLVNNQFAQQFSDMYQNAVRDSVAREKALRSFAEWNEPDIPTSEIY